MDVPDILLDTTQSLTLTDVCNSLPPRTVVDKLLAACFNAKYIQLRKYAAPIVKSPTNFHSDHTQWEVSEGGTFVENQ